MRLSASSLSASPPAGWCSSSPWTLTSVLRDPGTRLTQLSFQVARGSIASSTNASHSSWSRCVGEPSVLQQKQWTHHFFLYLQMEFDEKELRREISYAIKNIHGIRHVRPPTLPSSPPSISFTSISLPISSTAARPSASNRLCRSSWRGLDTIAVKVK